MAAFNFSVSVCWVGVFPKQGFVYNCLAVIEQLCFIEKSREIQNELRSSLQVLVNIIFMPSFSMFVSCITICFGSERLFLHFDRLLMFVSWGYDWVIRNSFPFVLRKPNYFWKPHSSACIIEYTFSFTRLSRVLTLSCPKQPVVPVVKLYFHVQAKALKLFGKWLRSINSRATAGFTPQQTNRFQPSQKWLIQNFRPQPRFSPRCNFWYYPATRQRHLARVR